ncbi:MAG: hypothetical protein GX964_05185 [Syntrophomonadaceae bacterium]|nr:hypothetical protein [Syntrophomonadaceae bacterium]
MRKIVVWCLVMLLVLGTTGTALSAEPKILANGQKAFCSVSPGLVNNQVVVPISDMAPNLKCSVGWDRTGAFYNTKKVVAQKYAVVLDRQEILALWIA